MIPELATGCFTGSVVRITLKEAVIAHYVLVVIFLSYTGFHTFQFKKGNGTVSIRLSLISEEVLGCNHSLTHEVLKQKF